MSDDGRGFAVWTSTNGLRLAIHEPNGAWGTPISIPSSKPSDPALAVNASGEGVIAWWQANAKSDPQIYAISLASDGTLWPPAPVSVEDEETGAPAVAIDDEGGAVVSWTGTNGLQFAIRERGEHEFDIPRVLIGSDNEAQDAVVALDDEEMVTFAWTEEIEGDRLLRTGGVHFDLTGVSGPETVSETFADAFEPQIALNSDGAGSIVWGSLPEGGTAETMAVSRDAAGSEWGDAERISDEEVDTREPALGVDDIGEVLFVWAEDEDVDAGIVGAGWDAENGYSEPFDFDAGPGAASPTVAVNEDGDSLVAWRQGAALDGTVRTAVRLAEQSVFTVAQVGGEGTNSPPAAAIEDDGNAFVAWPYREGEAGPASGELLAAGYDVGAPLVTALDVPAKALVGEMVPVAVSTWNVWNLTPNVRIEFGDGHAVKTATAEHAYDAPGAYTVSAIARNSNNLFSEPRTATIEVVTAGHHADKTPAGKTPAANKPVVEKTKLALLSTRSVRIADGAVVLTLENRGTRAVQGTLRLWTTARLDPQGKRSEVGSQAYSLGAGKSKRITVKLSADALELIRNKRTHRLATKATASFTDSTGKPGKTSRKVLLLGS